MDSLAAPPQSANLRMIKGAFDASAGQGFMAGLDVLLEHAHEDCEFRPYIASGDNIRGHEAIRAFYRSAMSAGTEMKIRATTFREDGDTVTADGTLRVGRPSGGFSESQISWAYTFRDGRLASASWCRRGAS